MRFSPGLLLSVSTFGPRTRITLLHGEGWRETAFESMAARQWSEVYPPIEAAVRGDAALPGESEPPLPLPTLVSEQAQLLEGRRKGDGVRALTAALNRA